MLVALLVWLTPAGSARASTGPNCRPYTADPCLFPFPDNRLTRPDRGSVTGLRLNLPQAAMPRSPSGSPVGVAPYNQSDGFSPGSAILLHVPQLDTQRALNRTHAVGLLNMSAYRARRAPILVIDERTGRRQMIYVQLDRGASSPAGRELMILPGGSWQDGHTYVVALRDLRSGSGRAINAPAWFEKLRDGRRLPPAERPQARRYVRIFRALKRAGIARDRTLYAAWDFTVASTRSLTGRLLAIRNSAFSQLGDGNLADGVVQGGVPPFTITGRTAVTWPGGATGTEVSGSFQAPCYLQACGSTATTGFNYGSGTLYATPVQSPGSVENVGFVCVVPSSATPSNPARVALYGHGLHSSMTEVTTSSITALAGNYNMVLCATDWVGLAAPDAPFDEQVFGDLNQLPALVDRLQQGVLNTLLLGRLLDDPQGFASSPSFQQGGQSVLNTGELFYDGNSLGGILGGVLTAVSPDIRRAVLGVTGEDFGDVLLPRSADFGSPTQPGSYSSLIRTRYSGRGAALEPLTLDLMDQLWARADPVGYVEGLGDRPLPDTPSHAVLMQIAYGDHQVSMYAGAAEARSIGADAYEPAGTPASALSPGGGRHAGSNRAANANLLYGLAPVPLNGGYTGSVIEVWDSGPGHTLNPPVGNLAPPDTAANVDPHEDPQATPLAQEQIADFLAPGGAFVNVCGGQPCHSHDYTP